MVKLARVMSGARSYSTRPKRDVLRWRGDIFARVLFGLVLGLAVLDAPALGQARISDDSSVREVVAGVPRSWPPQYSVDENGNPTGFAIDVMEEIAARAGLRVGYRVMDSFAEVSDAMDAGQVDLVPNSGITPGRAAQFDFTAPVETFVVSIFVRDDTLGIEEEDDLQGRKVGVVERNIGHRLMRDRDDLEMVVYPDAGTALFSLVAGHVDAMVFPQPVLMSLARQVGIEDRIKVVGAPLREVKRGIRVQKGEAELLAALNQAVHDFVGTPKYQAIYMKWYGRPEPFWTDWRVLAASGTAVFLVLIAMAWWRYHSVVALNRDLRASIAERMSAELALRESDERFQAFIEHSPTKIHIKDADGRYILINKLSEELFGLTNEEAKGKTAHDIFPQDVSDAFMAHDRTVVDSGQAVTQEEEFRLGDKDLIFLNVKFPIKDSTGAVVAVGSVGTDITERKAIGEALARSEERLRQAAQLTKVGHWAWDVVADKSIYCSREQARIHGVSVAEYLARAVSTEGDASFTHPDDRDEYRNAMSKSLAEGAAYDVEYRLLTPAGETRHVRELGQPVFDDDGALVEVYGTVQDITEVKQAEESLRQAQKMEAVGQLTGGVAHDFNNLLAVILGQAELLEDRLGKDDPSLRGVVRAATRGAQLTQRLLAFSRRQSLAPEAIDLNALVAGMMDLLRRTLGETIEIELLPGPELWNTLADPGQVENALLNLAINARDAMPEGGKLIVIIDNVSIADADASAYAGAGVGDYVRLSVADTGKGMTGEVRERALEPFFTTKDVGEGSGLGLPMVYGFVRQSGGFVSIDSEPGRGTAVALYLPRARIPERQPVKPAPAEEPAGRGEAILVVEDDPDVRQLTVTMLASLGYEVIEAADGHTALEMLNGEMLNGASGVELMLSDVVLPGGMSGPRLADEVKRRHADIKVLFMSGHIDRAIERQPPEVSANLLKKPFRRRDLAAKIRTAFDSGID